MRSLRAFVLLPLALLGCPATQSTVDSGFDAGVVDAGSVADAGTDGGTDAGVSVADSLVFFQKISGLWAGPVTMTVLGDFPTMNVDIRPASDHVSFGRVDLNAGNSLRFAFSIETFGGVDVLTYRNGGYFQGVMRDMRTQLVSVDPVTDTWRFCHVTMGCSYIDARFEFDAADQLHFLVDVKGTRHVNWQAVRKETRALPNPFPVDTTSQGPGDAPFPTMPQVAVTVNFPAVPAATTVLVVFSTTPCGFTGACTPSRTYLISVPSGATTATATLDQFHAGDYRVTAVLDRNNNLMQILTPDQGDGVSQPDQAVTVAATGTTNLTLTIAYTVP